MYFDFVLWTSGGKERQRKMGRKQGGGKSPVGRIKGTRLAAEFSGFVVVWLEGTYSVASFCSPPLLTQRMLVLFPVLVWGVNRHLDNSLFSLAAGDPSRGQFFGRPGQSYSMLWLFPSTFSIYFLPLFQVPLKNTSKKLLVPFIGGKILPYPKKWLLCY